MVFQPGTWHSGSGVGVGVFGAGVVGGRGSGVVGGMNVGKGG